MIELSTDVGSNPTVRSPRALIAQPGGTRQLRQRGCPRAAGGRLLLAALLGAAAGCGTTRVTDTHRTATEQLLVSAAVDQAVSQFDFRILAGKPVFFDAQYLQGSVDYGYVVSSLRQHLLACGCLLQEDRAKATYVVEARAGAVGTDLHQLLFGIPQMNLPALIPGQPALIPEIPLAKRTDQKGAAKLAVFAYNRLTGRPVWQSGVVQMVSTSKDTWLFGTGPFRRGTLGEDTEIAGQAVAIPLLSGKEAGHDTPPPVVAVTRPASWDEPFPALTSPGPLTGQPAAAEQPGKVAPAPPSIETIGVSKSDQKAGAVPAKPAGAAKPVLQMEPIYIPGFKPAGAGDLGNRGAGTAGSPPAGRDADARKATGPPPPGSDRPK